LINLTFAIRFEALRDLTQNRDLAHHCEGVEWSQYAGRNK